MMKLFLSRREHDALLCSKWAKWLKDGEWSLGGVKYNVPEHVFDEITRFLEEDS